MGPVVSTPGIRKGTRVGEKRKRWRKGLKRQKGEGQDDGSLRRAGDRLGVGEDTQRGAGLGDLREDWWWGAGTCWLGKAFRSLSGGRPGTAAVPWCLPCAGWGAVPALQTWEWGGGQWSLHIFHPGIPQILSFRLQLQAPPEPPVLPVREGRAGAAAGRGRGRAALPGRAEAGAEASGWGLGGGPDDWVCTERSGRGRAARVRPQQNPIPSRKLPATRLGISTDSRGSPRKNFGDLSRRTGHFSSPSHCPRKTFPSFYLPSP